MTAGADPVLYELSAEIVYEPGGGGSEGLSAGLIVLVWNAAALVMLAAAPSSGADVLNLCIVAVFVAAAGSIALFVRESYGRSNAEVAAGGAFRPTSALDPMNPARDCGSADGPGTPFLLHGVTNSPSDSATRGGY